MADEKIFLGIPTHDRRVDIKVNAMAQPDIASKEAKVHYCRTRASSLLANNFNVLFCDALNGGYTHFLLLHADIAPTTPGWADRMLELMNQRELDILSVISPFKDRSGRTSTGIDNEDEKQSHWGPPRLTMHEVHNEWEDVITHPRLVVNTGCLLIDLRGSWLKPHPPAFTINDGIGVNPDGKYQAVVEPEDWGFSRIARRRGAKIGATALIEIEHIGYYEFRNSEVWGLKDDSDGNGKATR